MTQKLHDTFDSPNSTRSVSNLPPVIFGTSGLGNLFTALDENEKLSIVNECIRLSEGKVVFDSAGKYGAGLALETLGKYLKQLGVERDKVIISNKLGWFRSPLTADEPTFEPGVWKNLKHDAVQKISYQGIIECFEQGNELLDGYPPEMVSVHDPDEYLMRAVDNAHRERLYDDIINAYRALHDLKKNANVSYVGVGAKDWRVIQWIAEHVELDWIMIANSMTIKSHPHELLEFVAAMSRKGVYVINSAVFHSGFLVGSDYYDYKLVQKGTPHSDALFKWRTEFFKTCEVFNVTPAEACVQFALNIPGVKSIALNTTNATRVRTNLEMANAVIPQQFWQEMENRKLIDAGISNLLTNVK